jgi:hypothetical protein
MRATLVGVMTVAWLLVASAAIAQNAGVAPTPGRPAASQPATTPPPPVKPKPKEKVLDPDLIFQVGVTGGRVRGSEFTDATDKVRGRIIGNPKRTSIGPGEGIQFDGEHDWLDVTTAGDAGRAGLPTREFTVSAWVNMTKTTPLAGLIGCLQDTGEAESGWQLGSDPAGFYLALASSGDGSGKGRLTYVRSPAPVVTGRWYHVVGTYDGRRMRLFVNGEAAGESPEQSGDIVYPSGGAYVVAAHKDDDELRPTPATILEVKVLKRALAPAQIVEEYTPGVRLVNYTPELEATQRFVAKPYLQAATTDGMTIMWETARPGQSVIEYGESLPYTKRTEPSTIGTLHEVRLSGLKPQTNYFYRVRTLGDDGAEIVGDDLTFQTAVLPETPFAFAVIGDTQKNKPVIEKLQAFTYTLRPNLQIHVGDVVDKGPDKAEWADEFLAGSWPLMSRVCLYPTIGNHEDNHSHYYNYFSLPTPECWYTYTYGNAQFFSIDTNKSVEPGTEQYAWLDRELGASRATWKFVYHHHPVYSSDEDDYGDTYKGPSTNGDKRLGALRDLLEKHRVDIDFCGHIHSYERTWPIYQGKVDEAKGVRYITSGGGGGGLESAGPQRTWFAQRVYRGHHVLLLAVHDKFLQLQAFDLEGRLIDQMDIRKP